MKIDIAVLGGYGGQAGGGSGGGGYDDTAVRRDIKLLQRDVAELKVSASGGAAYDDTAVKQEVAKISERLAAIENTRKEFQAAYIPRSNFPSVPKNNAYLTINFPKPFSKTPFVKATLDIQDSNVRVSYLANATSEGFDIAINYAGSLNGVWYEAYIID